ncbi:MAG: RidA family protein [Betaproteobacteria bacterium]|nr:RidA family protein [Betaproteobacteria bacterium]
MKISHLQPQGVTKPAGAWTSVVVVENPGKLAFLSGFIARDEKGEILGVGDIRAQTRRVCELLQTTVRAAGGELKDLVRVDVFVRDIDQFAAIHEVRREFFPEKAPASTMVEVSRMVDERALIEINAIAVIP